MKKIFRFFNLDTQLQLIELLNMKKFLAELIGTYFLVFFGTGSIILHELKIGNVSNLGIA